VFIQRKRLRHIVVIQTKWMVGHQFVGSSSALASHAATHPVVTYLHITFATKTGMDMSA